MVLSPLFVAHAATNAVSGTTYVLSGDTHEIGATRIWLFGIDALERARA